jgi:hypothetical protein
MGIIKYLIKLFGWNAEREQNDNWKEYSLQFDNWFETNKSRLGLSNLNQRHLKILLGLAKAGEEGLHIDIVKLLWGWDGTNIGLLKFEKEFEQMQEAPDGGALYESKYSCRAYMEYGVSRRTNKQVASLTRAGRNFLIESKLI